MYTQREAGIYCSQMALGSPSWPLICVAAALTSQSVEGQCRRRWTVFAAMVICNAASPEGEASNITTTAAQLCLARSTKILFFIYEHKTVACSLITLTCLADVASCVLELEYSDVFTINIPV